MTRGAEEAAAPLATSDESGGRLGDGTPGRCLPEASNGDAAAHDDVNTHDVARVAEDDTMCGLGSWRPPWLQRLASKKTYVLLHGLIGLNDIAIGTYYVGTISMMEKRFKIPSQTTGIITAAWDLGSFLSMLVLSYLGSGRKTRFVSMGIYITAAACLIRLLPHWLYGPGQDALELTKEYGASLDIAGNRSSGDESGTFCGGGGAVDEEDCSDGGSLGVPSIIFFITSLLMGVGSSVYWTLGITYLDDNTRKNKAPLALAATSCIRMLGPTLGFTYASYAASRYVDPTLTPVIDKEDPRWIGAWWFGWGPASVSCLALGSLMLLFPRQLPRAAQRRAQRLQSAPPAPQRQLSFKDFRSSLARLLRTRVLVFNTMSSVCFMFGYIGYWIFMPKYIETQYRQSAAQANLITGTVGLVFMGLGIATSAVVITKFKPRARTLAAWSVFVEMVEVFGHFSWAFLGCGERDLHGDWASGNTWNLTADCNAACGCGPEVKYSPVCSSDGAITFYSPCHAGCIGSQFFANGTTMYSGCACALGGVVTEGSCARDCTFNFAIFLATDCIMRFLASSGKAGNMLVQFRCVDEEDKPLALAFSEFLLCGLAFIPGPIIYGMLLDSACLVWGEMCGKSGNCWLYNEEALRRRVNFTAATLLFCGMILDIAVWYHCKNLQIYDEDDDATKKKNKLNVSDQTETPFLEKA